MNVWKAAGPVVIALAGLAIALVLHGKTGGLALVVYVFVLGVALVALALSRLGRALPLAPQSRRLLPQPRNSIDEVEQFRTIARQLTLSSWSEHDLHLRLRPLIQEIARARLARQYGVDLDREPERARALIGSGPVWELIRPDRERPEDRQARGWSEPELERLMDELEDL
jgi:hypothetical protein